MATPDKPVTVLLRAWTQGDPTALEQLLPLVYAELHRLAVAYMRRERPDHTFTPTELVSEAFLRLVGGARLSFTDRVQFFALAARQMRRILVDHARRRIADKRGGKERAEPFDDARVPAERSDELVALDDALDALAALDERKARVVELHYFGGMSQKEIAEALSVHENTVARELKMAQAWLCRQLKRDT